MKIVTMKILNSTTYDHYLKTHRKFYFNVKMFITIFQKAIILRTHLCLNLL